MELAEEVRHLSWCLSARLCPRQWTDYLKCLTLNLLSLRGDGSHGVSPEVEAGRGTFVRRQRRRL